ncbi:isoleucine--tRNA ligase [Jeotgalibacillus salarius]|uniref:Isoleucine--tRNA ligase n=1 Tax=Jeotgalibacillus salarius TaxID=546023 RepID=A0A4Y8LHS8_9BACL|nr:isoleucine--tRNA ligase [Jeotgalibacillus salarius]TFE02386.1 isoleucine--tRNA ligase [Jeotgalibacillus salarius]
MTKRQLQKTAPDREKRVQDFWRNEQVFQRSIDQREGKETFVFYEGPPTANGLPHAGHVLGRVIKDFVARYKTMSGYQVLRKAGWDTHGLPVELGVEKKLGLSGKREIEEYGVEKFIDECKKSVFDYEKQWRTFTDAIGYWVDMDEPYVTLENRYIESVWHILSTIHKRGLLEQGHRVVPYCPSCQTSLSSHEVAQGYKDVKDLSVTAKFKVKNTDNEYFLGWTTTPWTLPSNVALAVNRNLTYIKVKQGEEVYIVAKNLADQVFKEEYEVVSTHQGSELTGLSYEPPLNYLTLQKGHEVIAADFVTEDNGTGIVHLAPAHGEDDYQAIKDSGLDFVKVVDETGRYTAEVTPFAGEKAKDQDVAIIKLLSESGRLFDKEKYEHSYPHCWRCDSALIYYAMEGWFIKTTALKDTIVANNQSVEWHPDHMKDGRFGKFLEGMVDWNLGRNRYWGTPLNVWVCDDCGHQHAPDSVTDLRKQAKNDIGEDLDLHKPYVDQIQLTCSSCAGTMNRTKEVIDVWFDSGSMPFAQYHYPFENKELFEKQFPADVIAEGVDQTRGWFYSLLTVSSLFTGKAPYKRVLSLGHILDEDGRKMSKSKGNVINPMELVEQYGADALRWALLADSAPWNNKRFSANLVGQAKSKLVDTLHNVHSFYRMYADIDGFDPAVNEKGKRALLDEWILSRLTTVTEAVCSHLDAYDFTAGARELAVFVDELSNWYIRRSRNRFWGEDMSDDKLAAYHTLHEVLITLSRLIAPFTPFIAEDIHLDLTEESVHLADFPKADPTLRNSKLEADMDRVLQVVELARQLRNATSLKTKQPLASVTVIGSKEETEPLRQYEAIIMDEMNVKAVNLQQEAGEAVRYEVKLNFPTAGQKLGKKVGAVQKELQQLTSEEARKIAEQGFAEVADERIEGEDLQVRQQADEGLELASNADYTVLLDTVLTEELKAEGLVRELIRGVQQYRKELNLPVDQRVVLVIDADEKMRLKVTQFRELLESNLLVRELKFGKNENMKRLVVDGEEFGIAIE